MRQSSIFRLVGERKMKDHQLFEVVVAELHQFLSPSSLIKQNQKIQGRSGVVRQIDILIEDNSGVYPIKIVVDCKHYKTPVDIKEVEAVWMLVDDVRANLGIVISDAGFTEGALKRARDIGLLKLCTILDLQHKNFSVKIALPAVMEKAEPLLNISVSPSRLSRLLTSEPEAIILKNLKTGQQTNLYQFFHRKILEGEIGTEGTGLIHLAADEWQLVLSESLVAFSSFKINYRFVSRFYFGMVPVIEGQGILEILNAQKIYTQVNFLRVKGLILEAINIVETEKWEVCGSLEEIPVPAFLNVGYISWDNE